MNYHMILKWITDWWKNILAIIGAITIILVFIKLLFEVIPRLNKTKTNLLKNLAQNRKNKNLIKNAIASDIETHVNEVVMDLQNELPSGWIQKASIQWIKEATNNDLREGEMILRIHPFENQDHNFLAGVYTFFSKALFPYTKEIIPTNARKAAVLMISYRTICDKKTFLQKAFEDSFLETAIKEDSSIASYLGKYKKIDQKGFFTGTFLREIHEIATKARFHDLRNRMGQEIDQILVHIEGFLDQFDKHKGIPPGGWYRQGPATSYAFLLVAKPDHQGVEPYLTQVRERIGQNIERLYVMGTKEQESFARYVISKIAEIPEYKLEEIFSLNRDYRKIIGGVGALFVTKNQQNKSIGQIKQTEIPNN